MVFSSMFFIWVFLPIALAIYYGLDVIIKDEMLKRKSKNISLLILSLIFYAFGGIPFVAIMLCSIVINFIGGKLISKLKKRQVIKRKFYLVVTIIINLLILFYFKYFNMVIVMIEQIMNSENDTLSCVLNIFNMQRTNVLQIKNIVLPIGISFFTFQAMSYVFDIYNYEAEAQKNIYDFGLYVALFPQLIAGPIVQYIDIEKQISERKETREKFVMGIKRFTYGLGKKVIIANTLAVVVDKAWGLNLDGLGSVIAWFVAICYALQIYYDFSGYSDMAIGLGLFFGFEFKENFDYPYMSNTIIEFWKRWHISLSSWFKKYIYIPLGGSYCSKVRNCINVLIVFLITGLWHGANFTFILWGLIFGIVQVIERTLTRNILEKNKYKFINFIYVNLIVILLWILFRADNINDAITYMKQLFILRSDYSILSFLSMKVIWTFVVGIICMGILQNIFKSTYKKVAKEKPIVVIDYALQILILIYSIILIVAGTYNPFIYFQF